MPHDYIKDPADVMERRVSPGALIHESQVPARSADAWGGEFAQDAVSDMAMSADTNLIQQTACRIECEKQRR